jgi:hypothetical protein
MAETQRKLVEHLEHCLECPLPGPYIQIKDMCPEGQRLRWADWDRVYGWIGAKSVQ